MLVEFETKDKIGYITLNRPQSLNALNHEMQGDLEDALEKVASDKGVRVVIVTGRGKAFCAGSDIKDLYGVAVSEADRIVRREARICQRIERLPQPAVAAVNGYALGGGCALALSHDIVIASEAATFGFPEVKLGWNPPYHMAQLLGTVGKAVAKELLLTGRMVGASEALKMGLVSRVVQPGELMAAAVSIAKEIADNPLEAVRAIKEIINNEDPFSYPAGVDYETRAFDVCFGTEEAKEKIRAFVERKIKRNE